MGQKGAGQGSRPTGASLSSPGPHSLVATLKVASWRPDGQAPAFVQHRIKGRVACSIVHGPSSRSGREGTGVEGPAHVRERLTHTGRKDRQGRQDRQEAGHGSSGTGRGRGEQRDGGRGMDRGRRRQTHRLGGGETGKRSRRRRKSRETGATGSLLPPSLQPPAAPMHLCLPLSLPMPPLYLLRPISPSRCHPVLPLPPQAAVGFLGPAWEEPWGLCWERHQSSPATQGRTRNQGLPCSPPTLTFPVLSLCPLNIPQTCPHLAPLVSNIASGSFRLVGSTLLCRWHSCTQVGCLQQT